MSSGHRKRDFLLIAAILCGLLYIPAFMYGFFWLWVLPFTALVTLFLRAMIDSAIARVARAGDEAKQAKAIIPEVIIINIVMTLLLFLPFASALWLTHAGTIENIHQSEIDKAIWWFVLGILKSQGYFKGVQNAHIQIILSNLFIMIFETITVCYFNFGKLVEILKVIFHKNSYKFLQQKPYVGNPTNFIFQIWILVPYMFVYGSCIYYAVYYNAYDLLNITGLCLFMCFLIPTHILGITSAYVIGKIQEENV